MLILQILSLEPAHGYGIAQRLEQISRSVVQVNQGSLYPALHRLEQKGWLKSEWKESETGRDAKFYALTASGRKQLALESRDRQRAELPNLSRPATKRNIRESLHLTPATLAQSQRARQVRRHRQH
jgi:PadR family transcriptional regulator, regulatory protein PadR